MTPLWRHAFNAIERPLAAGAESWVQSETFMDLATVAFRLQRRLAREVVQQSEQVLHLWGIPSRGDVVSLRNQVAALERQLREQRAEAQQQTRQAAPRREPQRARPRHRGGAPRTAV